MKMNFTPSKPSGTALAPPSKSAAHRALICAGLSNGESLISNIALSKDIQATAGCLTSLGAKIRIESGAAYVCGVDVRNRLGSETLDCFESGSTLRFFIPICLLSSKECALKGAEYLFTRPLSVYEDIAEKQNILFERAESSLRLKGRLKAGDYDIRGDISSQFISGLMFALPLLSQDSRLRVIPPVESGSYIRMTEDMMRRFGVSLERGGDYEYIIKGDSRYKPTDMSVEGDWSNAAFFEALNRDGDITVSGLDSDSLQGDKVCIELFERLRRGDKEPIDISDCPDLGPALFAVAAMEKGGVFVGTRRLRIKESDRAAAMAEELSKFSVKCVVEDNSVEIDNRCLKAPKDTLFSHNDHRIVMALSVMCTYLGGEIEGAQAVEKSFPDFFEKLSRLNVKVRGV